MNVCKGISQTSVWANIIFHLFLFFFGSFRLCLVISLLFDIIVLIVSSNRKNERKTTKILRFCIHFVFTIFFSPKNKNFLLQNPYTPGLDNIFIQKHTLRDMKKSNFNSPNNMEWRTMMVECEEEGGGVGERRENGACALFYPRSFVEGYGNDTAANWGDYLLTWRLIGCGYGWIMMMPD